MIFYTMTFIRYIMHDYKKNLRMFICVCTRLFYIYLFNTMGKINKREHRFHEYIREVKSQENKNSRLTQLIAVLIFWHFDILTGSALAHPRCCSSLFDK